MIAMSKDASKVVQFYLDHFNEVHTVTCNKCSTLLAVMVADPIADVQGTLPAPHANGLVVVPVDDGFLGSRLRLDGVMGFQCGAVVVSKESQAPELCLNDTRLTYIEEEESPSGQMLPHEVAAIQERHQTDYEPAEETFTVERVK